MLRFYRIWVDFDQDDFGGLAARRLFDLVERLGAYEGAVAARVYHIQQEEKNRNPSRAALDKPGTIQVDSLKVADPEIEQMFEIEQV